MLIITLFILFFSNSISATQTHHDNTNGLKRTGIRGIQSFRFHPRHDFYHFSENFKGKRDAKTMIHPVKYYNKERRGNQNENPYKVNSVISDKQTRRNFEGIPKLNYAGQWRSLNAKRKIALDPRLAEWRMQRRRSEVRNRPRQTVQTIGNRPRQTHYPVAIDLDREKKSTSDTSNVDNTMKMIKLFLFFIPLASLSAIVLTTMHYFWSKRSKKNKKNPTHGTNKSQRATSESIVGSTLINDGRSECNGESSLNKEMADEFVNKFVTNDFDGEGDVSAKRMKLERWMYQEPRYLPEMAQKKMKVNKEIENRFPKCSHARRSKNSSETSSSQSNSPPQIPFQPRPNYQKQILPTSIDEIRRPESEIMGTYNVATSKHPQAVLKTYSEDPAVLFSKTSKWDKDNRRSINSVDKSINNNNQMKNTSLVTFNSHYVTCNKNPAQRYDYTLGRNMV